MSSVFWVAFSAMAVTLVISTLLGRAVSRMIPGRLAPAARLYISPALGLAVLVVFASLVGRHVPMGALAVRLVLAAMFLLTFSTEPDRRSALKHAFAVTCFGVVCGSPILTGLFLHGSYFAYNDTFTYLAHSVWLQTHSFGTTVTSGELTPFSSQIAGYQAAGLRMGGSYLIALVQAIMGVRWSYAIYPVVPMVAVTTCCLAAGFPLFHSLRGMTRVGRWMLLSIPAFGLNGLTFGAVFGFAPQTLGMAFMSSLAFLIGYLLRWCVVRDRTVANVTVAAVPGAMLFAALTYAYSELMPFAVLGILSSAFITIVARRKSVNPVLRLGIAFGLVAVVLLNTEMLRAIAAIRLQANVVVGGPVNWSLSGFAAHALGIHGGAWDDFTWATRGIPKSEAYFVGMGAMLTIACVLMLAKTAILRHISDYSLLPTALVIALFGTALLYFRYGVRSPFPTGIGQSWSQFKLSEWAAPFLSVFVLLAISNLRSRVGKYLDAFVVCFFAAVVSVESIMWPVQLHGVYGYFTQYYGAPRSVGKFFSDFRETVISTCRPGEPLYLDLHGSDLKARETLAMYLADRRPRSDWRDDNYFNYYNLNGGESESASLGDCVIASKDDPKYAAAGTVSGPFRIIAASEKR